LKSLVRLYAVLLQWSREKTLLKLHIHNITTNFIFWLMTMVQFKPDPRSSDFFHSECDVLVTVIFIFNWAFLKRTWQLDYTTSLWFYTIYFLKSYRTDF
jgi:hypothetical protein